MAVTDSNRFVPYVAIYFHVYFFGGLLFQSVLLILILTKSPATLANLKIFLINTCTLQIILISLAFFTQHRSLPNSESLAVLPYGPCQKFGPNTCFVSYHLFLGVALSVGLGLSNTIIFRYRVLRNGPVPQSNILTMIALTYILSLATIIIPFTAAWNFAEVRAVTYVEHPTYDLSIYEPIVGFCSISSIQFVSVTILLGTGAYAIPAICGFLTLKVIRLINDSTRMSKKTKEQSRTLAYGLAWQTFLPLICYIPILSCYIISQINNVEMLITEHLLGILISLPSFVDPFISFYFISPYRQAILKLFKNQQFSNIVVSVPHLSKRNVTIADSK